MDEERRRSGGVVDRRKIHARFSPSNVNAAACTKYSRAQHTGIYSTYILVQHTYSSFILYSIRISGAGSGLHWLPCVFYQRTRTRFLKSAAFL